MFKTLVVGYDGSEGSKLALEKAIAICDFTKARLVILSVGRIPDYAETISEVEEAKEQAARYYGKMVNEIIPVLQGKGIKFETVIRYGKPADIIVDVAKEYSADLIVLGHSRHSYVKRRLIGGTAERVAELAPCSVLIVK